MFRLPIGRGAAARPRATLHEHLDKLTRRPLGGATHVRGSLIGCGGGESHWLIALHHPKDLKYKDCEDSVRFLVYVLSQVASFVGGRGG